MPNPTAPIATAIAEGFKLLKKVLDTSEARKMRKAIEAGERYIQVNEGIGAYEGLNEDKRVKYLKHFSKRFYKYN